MACFATAEGKRKVALITGITGQDGSYLAEFLMAKGYDVHGIVRRTSTLSTSRIDHLAQDSTVESRVSLHCGDLCDSANLLDIVQKIKPDEVYNLAAQSHVHISFEMPEYTANVDAVGTLRLLEALRAAGLAKTVRFYQASTSELFGKTAETTLQNECTPFHPRSPYAVAKLFAYWITVNYREAYGMYAVNGLLFNHESPRRGINFVTRKTTMAVARIHLGLQEDLVLGNLDARRDWGHAKDYVEAMWLMLQHAEPKEFVIATGQTHTIRQFVETAFAAVGLQIVWRGGGADETGVDQHGKVRVRIDKTLYRPAETDFLQGDASLAQRLLNWTPKVTFDALVSEMVTKDVALIHRTARLDA